MAASRQWLLASALAASVAQAFVPTWPATYQMNRSTIAMMCNYTGMISPAISAGWSIVDYDWSNSLKQWSASVPMDDEERLMQQAALTVAASPDTKVWIYRNSVYGCVCVQPPPCLPSSLPTGTDLPAIPSSPFPSQLPLVYQRAHHPGRSCLLPVVHQV